MPSVKNTPIAYRPLQSRLPVLNFSELFDLALIHILIQFPRCIFIRQGAPLHQVVDYVLKGKKRKIIG